MQEMKLHNIQGRLTLFSLSRCWCAIYHKWRVIFAFKAQTLLFISFPKRGLMIRICVNSQFWLSAGSLFFDSNVIDDESIFELIQKQF